MRWEYVWVMNFPSIKVVLRIILGGGYIFAAPYFRLILAAHEWWHTLVENKKKLRQIQTKHIWNIKRCHYNPRKTYHQFWVPAVSFRGPKFFWPTEYNLYSTFQIWILGNLDKTHLQSIATETQKREEGYLPRYQRWFSSCTCKMGPHQL